MITAIEINGFKTFDNFSMEMAPFVVIAGANGSGKSNLFDAFKLLSSLAKKDLKEAFSEQRGEARELFTQYSKDYGTKMSFAVELLLNKSIKDKWGVEKKLAHTRLRYELEVVRRNDQKTGLDKLIVENEHLAPIKTKEDKWSKNYLQSEIWKPLKRSQNYKPYIKTENLHGVKTIFLRQDGVRGGRPSPATEVERTVLSGINTADFPHAFAVREELLNWRLLHMNPIEMRQPSPMLGPDTIDEDGKYMPSMLNRMETEMPGTLKAVSRTIQNILPFISEIYIEEDKAREQFILNIFSSDGRRFSSRVLSEGTLRLLLLCALKYDDKHSGIICFEEPENGIHPFRMGNMLQLLKTLSTDFLDDEQEVLPLRQMFVNTHSPVFVKEYFERNEELLNNGIFYYASMVSKVKSERKQMYKITKVVPVRFGNERSLNFFPDDISVREYTHAEVINYLKSDDSESQILEKLEI